MVATTAAKGQGTNPEAIEQFESVEQCEMACMEVIGLAEAIMNEQKRVIEFQQMQGRIQDQQLQEAQKEIERRSKWYNNSLYMGLLGLAVGAIAVSR
jgi:hypothetical protein